ncbi:NapC/NirT family cytochrome c [Haliea sp. E17]|uniref:NapC/NirT family cytochrome c n=1 Tax=Haliea sp. E17 TaxID=3401576 RepID=UPI003AAA891F
MLAWLRGLLRPSPRFSVLALVAAGLVLGVVGVLAFNATMHATSSEAFCTSCHEMSSNPFAQLQETSHFSNASGVSASCSDCHVPHEFLPKMIRKIEASREVWGHLTGIIDTPEKYIAHAPAMKAREIARLRANDSQECRNCHNAGRMLASAQSAQARKYHMAMESQGKTCIDCHTGIAHPLNTAGLADHN